MKIFLSLLLVFSLKLQAQDAVIAVGEAEQEKDRRAADDRRVGAAGGSD